MTARISATILALFSSELLFRGLRSSDDPLFLFISNQKLVMVLRLLLVFLLLALTFKDQFEYRLSQYLAVIFGTALVFLGIYGAIDQTVFNSLFGYFRVLDFVMLINVGVSFVLVGLMKPAGLSWIPMQSILRAKLFIPLEFKSDPKMMTMRWARKS